MNDIVWIASYPKSGNTWIRTFLITFLTNARELHSLEQARRHSPLDSVVTWFVEASGENRKDWSEQEIAALRPAAHKAMIRRFKPPTFVKTHSACATWFGHPTIDLDMTAGAICIVRNPLDIAASYAAHMGITVNDAINAMGDDSHVLQGNNEQVSQLLCSWSMNVLSWTGGAVRPVHIMRYEDMVADAMAEFGKLIRFLNRPPEPERLERAVRLTSFESLQATEQRVGYSGRTVHQKAFFRGGQVGGWRKELNKAQIDRIVTDHGEQMTRFGYLPL